MRTLIKLHHHFFHHASVTNFHKFTCRRNFYRSTNLASTFHYDPKDPRLKFVEVKSHDSTYNVGYITNGPPGGSTILTVHGAPGGATDFDALSADLAERGVCTIMPNFPGNGVTTEKTPGAGKFDFSTRHRAEFIKNFLNIVQLENIDIVLGHSIAGPVALKLATDLPSVRALTLFNSVGYGVHVGVQPYWLMQLYSFGLSLPVIGYLLRLPLVKLYSKRGFKVDNVEQLVSTLSMVVGINFKQVKKDAQHVREKGLPVFSVASKNDRIVNWDRSLAVTQAAVNHGNVSHVDEHNNLTEGPSLDEAIPSRTIIFEKGRHFTYKQHGDVILKGLMDLVKHVQDLKARD